MTSVSELILFLASLLKAAYAPIPLFCGYTYSSGGHGAGVTTSLPIGAAERVTERRRINRYRLKGMWRDKPGLP